MELGVYSFGDIASDMNTNETPTTRRRLMNIVSQAKFADAAGIEVFALGEHHRRDFTISAPEVVLAAIASVTEKIRLSSAVTVLSTQDPVRVYQQYATLDQLSGGRAEVIAGRGAFIESFPLFGYDVADYETLFDEKIRLLLKLTREDRPVWQGATRSPLNGEYVAPRTLQEQLRVWIGVGGTPQSAVRAGKLGMPMFLAFFTSPDPGRRLIELYREAADSAGHEQRLLRTASGGHMFVGRTSQGARDDYYPYYSRYFRFHPQMKNGMPRSTYDSWLADGLIVGSPQQVIDKIMRHHELLGTTRYVGQFDVGGMPHGMAMSSLEIFASEVAPVIRHETRDSVRAQT